MGTQDSQLEKTDFIKTWKVYKITTIPREFYVPKFRESINSKIVLISTIYSYLE